MRTNTPLTIYNKYYDKEVQQELFQRWVIPAVMWENRKDSNVLATGGNLDANQAVIFIPFSYNKFSYIGPKAWIVLDPKTNNWTLQKDDILVKGEVTDELSSTFTPSNLKEKYDDVLKITSIDTYDMGSYDLQHWKIGAK